MKIKSVHINFHDPRYGDPQQPGTAAFAVTHLWSVLQSYFKVSVGEKGDYGIICYMTKGSSYGVRKVIALNEKSFANSQVELNTGDIKAIWHEFIHSFGVGNHKWGFYGAKLAPRWLSVMQPRYGSESNVPFLLLGDFWLLRKIMDFKQDSGDSRYSWNKNAGVSETFVNGERVRSFGLSYLYEILFDTTGINTLDFSSETRAVHLDLRPSLTVRDPVDRRRIDPHNVRGTWIEGENRYGPFNIYNAPNAKLDHADGGSAGDVMTGNALDNRLSGHAGNDTVRGLAGSDTLDGGDGSDTADYAMDSGEGGTKGVVVNLSDRTIVTIGGAVAAGCARDGFGTIDTLVSIENVTGTNADDLFAGSSGDNRFAGLRGRDTLNGGSGSDTADYSLDQAEGGTLGVLINLSNGIFQRNGLTLQRKSAVDGFGDHDTLISIENVIGTAFNDVIVGNGSGNRLAGGGGDDELVGRDGNDTLDGGAGSDTLVGGSGSDVFVYGAGYGADLVYQFAADGSRHDVLQISSGLVADLAALLAKGTPDKDGNAFFDFGDGNTLLLKSVTLTALNDRNVVFTAIAPPA